MDNLVDELIAIRGRLEDLTEGLDEDLTQLLEEARQSLGQALTILKEEK